MMGGQEEVLMQREKEVTFFRWHLFKLVVIKVMNPVCLRP